MFNHLNVVFKVDAETVEAWSDMKVVKQLHKVFGDILTWVAY